MVIYQLLMEKKILDEMCAKYVLADQVKAQGIYPYYRPISSGQDPVVQMNGKNVLMFGSNSYLGLSDDPRLKEAAKAAIDKYGTSCSGSRFLNGTLDIHVELEEKLAKLRDYFALNGDYVREKEAKSFAVLNKGEAYKILNRVISMPAMPV